jgi:hypothetical protein
LAWTMFVDFSGWHIKKAYTQSVISFVRPVALSRGLERAFKYGYCIPR